AVDAGVVAPARDVVLDRHRVEVPGEEHGRAGAGEQTGVAEVLRVEQGADVLRQLRLVARRRRDVDQLERPGGQAVTEHPRHPTLAQEWRSPETAARPSPATRPRKAPDGRSSVPSWSPRRRTPTISRSWASSCAPPVWRRSARSSRFAT